MYFRLSELLKKENDIQNTHSIDETATFLLKKNRTETLQENKIPGKVKQFKKYTV